MKAVNKVLITVLTCSVILTGCGGSSEAQPAMMNADYSVDSVATSGFYNDIGSYESADYYSEDKSIGEAMEEVDYEYDETEDQLEPEDPADSIDSPTVNKDMLIYRGSVSITTKNFDEDLQILKDTLSSFDCFFENESKWSNYSYDDRNLYCYSATVRVASRDYDKLLNGLNKVGTVTNLSSSCENASAEYTDTVVAIDIYEAERDRYLNLLSTITDDQYAIEVQRELTDIELKLAQFRARKQNIETDVSYSYVTIDLNEVREYTQQTEYNDTFLERLWDTIVNTFYGFVTFLENFLFLLIRVLPYVIFFALLYIILKKTGVIRRLRNSHFYNNVRDKRSKRKSIKEARKYGTPYYQHPMPTGQPVQKSESVKAEDKNTTTPFGEDSFF